jgi:hypothetical protein
LITAVIPFGAIAAASTSGTTRAASLNATAMPTPVNVDLGLTGRTSGRRVELSWKASRPPGSPVFYRVWRARGDGFSCPQLAGAPLCNITMQEVGVTREPAFVDRAPRGRWMYRIAIAANWLNDPGYGDPYVVSRPLTLAVK